MLPKRVFENGWLWESTLSEFWGGVHRTETLCDPWFRLGCYPLETRLRPPEIGHDSLRVLRHAVLRKAPSRMANVTKSAFVFSPNSFMIRYL